MGTTAKTAAIYVRRSAVEVYAEKVGTSASHLKNHKRPQLDRAMGDLGHSYGTLIVWDIDRQTRKGMAGRPLGLY